MAYRTFVDSNGLEWQTWDVLPKGVERRIADSGEHVSDRIGRSLQSRTVQSHERLVYGVLGLLAVPGTR